MTITGYRLSCKTARRLQYHLAGQRFLERLHLCPKRHNPEYQRHHHIQGDTENRPKAKYFLGIKIHRAILQISWDLTTEYSDTHVVEVITLDPDMSDKEKTKLVNDRIAEIAKEYPKCKITTEYARTAPQEDTKTNDMYHLLWSSDRLEIAREVDSRLTKIYATWYHWKR